MGQSNSRSKFQAQPYPLTHHGAPPAGAFYPPAPYPTFTGYPPPHAHNHNQHLVVPYTYFPQPQTQTRRTKRRRASANAGAVTRNPNYVSQAPSNNRHAMPAPAPAPSDSRPPPDDLFTPTTNGGTRLANFPSEPQGIPRGRTQTPFHGPAAPLSSEENDEGPPEVVIPGEPLIAPSSSQHQRRHSEPLHRSNLPPPAPLDPTRPSAFDRPLWSPSGNPLPEPPRDLFDSDAYKAVLNIPRGTDLFTALYGYQRNQIQQPGQQVTNANIVPDRTRTGMFGRKNSKGGGGLFRTLTGSRNRKQNPPEPTETARDRVRAGDVRLVPFPVPVTRVTSTPEAGSRSASVQPTEGAFRHIPPSGERYVPPTIPATRASVAHPATLDGRPPSQIITTNGPPIQSHPPFPVMTAPPRASSSSQRQSIFHPEPPARPQQAFPPLVFTQGDRIYEGFFPHSPHRVIHLDISYPTATHLHEALKYLPAHPDIANQIRLCVDLASVYPLSAHNTAYVRPDWSSVFLVEMEKVLEQKFRQHSALRELLVERVEGGKGREIIYRDEMDMFWGDGGGEGRGANELGKILGRVRDLLVDERMREVDAQRGVGPGLMG